MDFCNLREEYQEEAIRCVDVFLRDSSSDEEFVAYHQFYFDLLESCDDVVYEGNPEFEIDVNLQGYHDEYAYGWALLHYAAYNAYELLTETLLKMGADPNIRNQYGQTPIFYALSYGDEGRETLRMLLNAGADINAQDSHGFTVLRKPAMRKRYDVLKMYLEAGANPNIRGRYGDKVLSEVLESNLKESAEILRKYGAIE